MANFYAAQLNNEATQLEMAGHFAASEAKYLEALQIRQDAPEVPDISLALTSNALGELYLKMGRLDDAERMLIGAEATRSRDDNFDLASTRDNIGRLHEMKGDFEKAKEWRLKGSGNNHMLCSNFDCPKSSRYQLSSRSELSICARCKCVYYCGKQCQRKDFKRHKAFCRELLASAD